MEGDNINQMFHFGKSAAPKRSHHLLEADQLEVGEPSSGAPAEGSVPKKVRFNTAPPLEIQPNVLPHSEHSCNIPDPSPPAPNLACASFSRYDNLDYNRIETYAEFEREARRREIRYLCGESTLASSQGEVNTSRCNEEKITEDMMEHECCPFKCKHAANKKSKDDTDTLIVRVILHQRNSSPVPLRQDHPFFMEDDDSSDSAMDID